MGYVSSPWPLLFYQLVGHPFSLWGVSFWYLWCTCSNLYTIRVFVGGICDELSSGCVENKNTLTYCIYIYAAVMLLPSLCDSVGVLLYVAGMLLLCCCFWYAAVAAVAMLLLRIWHVVVMLHAALLLCCCVVVAFR